MKKRLIIGVDPGDRWTGVAQLLIDRQSLVLSTFVLDGANRSINEIVDLTIPAIECTVIAEEFRQRPIGHQRFGGGLTSRLLGALEYKSVLFKGQWSTVQAGAPSAVWGYPIGLMLKYWKQHWPRESDSRWEHALSAWRVICTSLMREQTPIYRLISNVKATEMSLDDNTIPSNVDMISPFASWPRPQ